MQTLPLHRQSVRIVVCAGRQWIMFLHGFQDRVHSLSSCMRFFLVSSCYVSFSHIIFTLCQSYHQPCLPNHHSQVRNAEWWPSSQADGAYTSFLWVAHMASWGNTSTLIRKSYVLCCVPPYLWNHRSSLLARDLQRLINGGTPSLSSSLPFSLPGNTMGSSLTLMLQYLLQTQRTSKLRHPWRRPFIPVLLNICSLRTQIPLRLNLSAPAMPKWTATINGIIARSWSSLPLSVFSPHPHWVQMIYAEAVPPFHRLVNPGHAWAVISLRTSTSLITLNISFTALDHAMQHGHFPMNDIMGGSHPSIITNMPVVNLKRLWCAAGGVQHSSTSLYVCHNVFNTI